MADTELKNQENTETLSEKEERTFTQDELNEIIKGRIAKATAGIDELKAKAKRLDEIEEANKTELEKANERAENLKKQLDAINEENAVKAIRQKVAEETGVNANYLTGKTEDECRQIASNFLAFAEANRKPVAPIVKDGGEPKAPTLSKADILGIKNERERLKAIQDNIDLFS